MAEWGVVGQPSCYCGPPALPSCFTSPGREHVLSGRFLAVVFIPRVVHVLVAGNPVAACLSAVGAGELLALKIAEICVRNWALFSLTTPKSSPGVSVAYWRDILP